ncbi:hypothetical protein [Streptomyces sp. NBC_00582]|uniref:hypothetical protein n=1 Tax=Streptomyces sp. NBC_00582 TaxID=2975783 RepID=UPI002E81CCC7|nr:hypothetical protein [Streptomyces sp. NBC_00582]WUB64449.1 hypothetical protein OG852_30675 [Streptomyces sp. NBC_00582]
MTVTAAPGADEIRVRQILRLRGVGPDAEPQPTAAAAAEADRPQSAAAADPIAAAAEWWRTRPTPAAVAAGDESEGAPDEGEPAEAAAVPDDPPRKGRRTMFPFKRGAPDDEPQPQPQPTEVAPGIHITVQPPQPAETPAQQRDRAWRQAVRRWLAVHGAAAGVGWAFGLKTAITAMLTAAQNGGVAAGLALAAFSYVGAEYVMARYLRIVPPPLRPAAMWVLRIPFATALLATALYTPNALIGAST